MAVTHRASAIVALLVSTLPAQATDLTKIERTIPKEPAFQSKSPQYGLLVFGPEANSRAWIVLDGDFLYREDLVLAGRPANAPVVHLNGPPTFRLADAPKTWAAGETIAFVVLFGTPDLGPGMFAYPIQSFKVRPLAEIQFPAKTPGNPPIVTQVRLTECARAGFVGG